MAEKKLANKEYTVHVNCKLYLGYAITASSVEEAMSKGRAQVHELQYTDLVESSEIMDGEINVFGAIETDGYK